MATIINGNSTIRVNDTIYQKDDVGVTIEGTKIVFKDNLNKRSIEYSEISSPTSADISALLTTVNYYIDEGSGVSMSLGDSPSIDAFARLRVSENETLFDTKQLFDNQSLFWDDQEVSGGGTSSTYSALKSSSIIAVSGTTTGKRVRQTFMRSNYQSGKSQLVFMTGTLGAVGGGAGITRAMGYFDDNNGIFFRDNEGVVEAVIRSKSSGSVVDNSVTQSNWNLDKLDGTGKSGLTLQAQYSQVAIWDFEWSGAGRVRTGFIFAGMIVYVHEFNHSNELGGVYMQTPNLPLRYEIANDGTGIASELECLCGTVISEGGSTDNGHLHYKSTDGTIINANAITDTYIICGIRLKSAYIGTTIKIASMSLMNDTGDDFEWTLRINPTVANSVTFNDVTNSALQFAVGNSGNPSNSTVTGGVPMVGGYVKSGGSSGDVTLKIPNALLLGSAIDGTVDEIYLCVKPLTTNANINGGITWREIN